MERMDYEEHERDWKMRHKASIPRRKRVSSFQEIFWIGFWIVVATGAAIYSAAHTIPAAVMTIFMDVPDRNRLALTVFVIVELVIFGAAAGRHEMKWLRWLLIGAVIVALIGNLGSSIRAVAENGGDILNQIVGIFIAVITPFTALAAGEALHIQWDKRNAKIQAEETRFQNDWREMDSKINRSFNELEKTFSKNSVNVNRPTPVHSVNSVNSANGYSKQMNSRQIISEYFERHPEFKNMTLDQLNEAIEQESGIRVGRTSIHNVRKEWVIPASSNGHSTLQ